jgi:hypothetical protein
MFTSWLGGWFSDFLSKVVVGWIADIRAHLNALELGAQRARNEGLRQAEEAERLAREAGERAAQTGDDPFNSS